MVIRYPLKYTVVYSMAYFYNTFLKANEKYRSIDSYFHFLMPAKSMFSHHPVERVQISIDFLSENWSMEERNVSLKFWRVSLKFMLHFRKFCKPQICLSRPYTGAFPKAKNIIFVNVLRSDSNVKQ